MFNIYFQSYNIFLSHNTRHILRRGGRLTDGDTKLENARHGALRKVFTKRPTILNTTAIRQFPKIIPSLHVRGLFPRKYKVYKRPLNEWFFPIENRACDGQHSTADRDRDPSYGFNFRSKRPISFRPFPFLSLSRSSAICILQKERARAAACGGEIFPLTRHSFKIQPMDHERRA